LTNILFLIKVHQTDVARTPQVREAIVRGMNVMIALQNGQPAPGWSRQYYSATMKPAPARTYEPLAINTTFTVEMIEVMQNFYKFTGETKFLNGIPMAIDFLESLELTDEQIALSGRPKSSTSIMVPRNVDPVTGIPTYTHRRGGNIADGRYFHNENLENTIGHMSSFGSINITKLRREYAETKAIPREDILKNSALLSREFVPLPRFYSPTELRYAPKNDQTVKQIISSLNKDGLWITPLPFISNVYKPMPESMFSGKKSDDARFASTQVGDEWDTSPFPPEKPVPGVSTSVFITNMAKLIRFLETEK
jgi:hypothetical protein